MIALPGMIVVIFVFAAVQISIFRALPGGIRKYLAYWPAFAIILNFLGSFVILFFSGTAYFVGPMNLISSVIFAAYIIGYKKYRGIHKVRRGKLKFPGLAETNPEGNWLF